MRLDHQHGGPPTGGAPLDQCGAGTPRMALRSHSARQPLCPWLALQRVALWMWAPCGEAGGMGQAMPVRWPAAPSLNGNASAFEARSRRSARCSGRRRGQQRSTGPATVPSASLPLGGSRERAGGFAHINEAERDTVCSQLEARQTSVDERDLRRSLVSHAAVLQAMRVYVCSPPTGFAVRRHASQHGNVKLRVIARVVVDGRRVMPCNRLCTPLSVTPSPLMGCESPSPHVSSRFDQRDTLARAHIPCARRRPGRPPQGAPAAMLVRCGVAPHESGPRQWALTADAWADPRNPPSE